MLLTFTLLALAAADVPDAGVLPPLAVDAGIATTDVDEGDEELEEMRALEDVAIEPQVPAAAPKGPGLREQLAQLGYGSLTRDRLENALDAAELSGEEFAFQLDAVTDVDNFDVTLVADRYDIPVEMQPLVAQYIRFFQGGGRKWFRRWMSRSHRYIPLMQPILEARGMPRDTVYLSMIESGFNTQAKSWARAVGPWQFIPGTAKMFKLRDDFWVDERRDPIKSTHAAASYLTQLHDELGHWYLAWAGYNTGGGRVRKMVDKYGTTDFWQLSEYEKKQGYAFAKETKHYVPKLIACALVAKHPEAFGFSLDEFKPESPFVFDEVKLTDSVDLEVIAQASGASVEEIQEFNPELKRWCTPPASEKEPYVLRLPKGRLELFAENFAKYAPSERLNFKIHRVAKGDTLSKIALQYHSAQEAILRMNHLTSVRTLKLGSDLIVPVPSAQALKAGKEDTALERQVARARRSGLRAGRPEDEVPAGTQTASSGKAVAVAGTVSVATVDGKKKVTYGIGKGDSLWSIARRFDVHVADLKEWNPSLGSARGLKVGAALTVWPGPAADLSSTGASR
ncbi:MAG: lytic transglycosylase [Archangium gephyra]|uniref:Lytic transglycosylase n=1 Tax=Archangium gephyra TaxID=48 RepID=A0A2W5UU99_9BACT|nr:MAG: lytic transglycosylase [Archangium gephyra]